MPVPLTSAPLIYIQVIRDWLLNEMIQWKSHEAPINFQGSGLSGFALHHNEKDTEPEYVHVHFVIAKTGLIERV